MKTHITGDGYKFPTMLLAVAHANRVHYRTGVFISVEAYVPKALKNRLPLRDDVTELEYHRKPTASEIAFGEGATHYATFPVEDCCHAGTRIAKKRLVVDGLVYTR